MRYDLRTEVIAEIGINHQNDIDIVREMVGHLADMGVQTVKFQASTVVEEVSFKAAPEHFEELGRLVPTTEFLRHCTAICAENGMEFLCTPAGPQSLRTVLDLGVKRIKISSDNLTNVAFLRECASTGLPIILSTGMATFAEVLRVSDFFSDCVILHCVSSYPCPVGEVGLMAMRAPLSWGHDGIGLSDHTTSLIVPSAAVALGAKVIEKHVTLDKRLPGPDHAASLTLSEFEQMLANITEVEAAMGDGIKRPQPSEIENMHRYRKSLVAARPIVMGEMFTVENVTAKRPGIGVPADQYDAWIGKHAARDYEEDELL